MLTFRKGTGGAPTAAQAMAEHLRQQTLPEELVSMADYYLRGVSRAEVEGTAAIPRQDMSLAVAEALGLDVTRAATHEEVVNLLRGFRADGAEIAGKRVQPDVPALDAALGLAPDRMPTSDEMGHVLAGRRADGARVEGAGTATARARFLRLMGVPGAEPDEAQADNLRGGRMADGRPVDPVAYKAGVTARQERITYVDFTFSAPKSVSIAMALAPTEAERHMIVGAHRDAWMAAMAYLEGIVAHARKGKGGSKGSVPGELGWVSFDHYTARPTVEIPHTEADGTRTTLIQTVRNPKVAGDMQLHTHVTTPNVVVCEDGGLGSMDLLALHDRVHEVGAYYQAHLATNLRAFGIEVVLDERTESARLPAVPEEVCEAFSKRTRDGEAAAREYVAAQGLDWDAMHPMELAGVLKGGTRATRRQKETELPGDDMSDLAAWRAQASTMGYEHETVIDPAAKNRLPAPESDRLLRGYLAALPVLEKQLGRRATMYASVARTAAARGLIASGVEGAADIDRITEAMREHGVRHDGQAVPLVWAHVVGEGEREGAQLGDRRPRVKITTTRHVEQEEEAMALASAAAADRTGALTPGQIARAVALVAERDGLDFTSEHGLEQRRVMDALGTAGRFAVAVGVAGAGKSTLLRPLVEAWTTPPEHAGDERQVYGTALAWRQSDLLADAGIEPRNTMAIAALLERAKAGKLRLNERSVVVVDELSQVGTAQALGLLRLRAEHNFTLVAIGDDKQAQAIEAGNSIGLLRRALGAEAIPELESTVRQRRDRDKETSLLFREGQAAEGIERLREDGHAVLVQGGHTQAVEAVADLWAARQAANAGREDYTLTVSAPTNADARAIGAAIRERRRVAGALGADRVVVQATDQNRAEYDLPLAVGDRVRLFARTPAAFGGKGGNLGNNGSVVEVEEITAAGLRLRNAKGNSGLVKWDTLRDADTGRIRLTYGDAITLDAIQSATSTEHINAMPSGSQAVQSFKNYVGQSRSRETTWLVVADGRERAEIMQRRTLGDAAPITEDQVWTNVARNLSRQPEKELATALLERVHEAHIGTVRSLATAFQPRQQRRAEGGPESTLHDRFAQGRDERDVARAAPDIAAAVREAAAEARREVKRLTGPQAREERQAAREARRSARGPSQRPKAPRPAPIRPAPPRPKERPPISALEAEAEFREALHSAGLRPRGAIQMDGRRHYTEIEGSKSKRGFYVAHLDGEVPAGTIINHKTGQRIDWVASRPRRELSAAERRAERERQAAAKAAREAEQRHREAATARKARAIWNRAGPAQSHAYLAAKGVGAHGLRQDRHGNLLVPMRDMEGRIWGLQTISPAGDRKLYMKDARKRGTHAMLGELQPGEPLVIAEGFATAATVREATGLTVAAAFDGGNLLDVARAFRERDPTRPIIFAADNDHHLPRRAEPLSNVGLEKAQAAAAAVGGIVLLPPELPGKGTDWNDYAAQRGQEAVRALAAAELRPHGIELATAAAPRDAPDRVVTQAERDAARQRTASNRPTTPADAAQAAAQAARQEQQHRPRGPRL